MISEGQQLALDHIERICIEGPNDIRLINIKEPENESGNVLVSLKVYCANMPREANGLPLRRWENFKIYIPCGFPFDVPSVYVPHSRFHGFGHVQWKYYLCLYLSKNTEWNPSDGMYGYLQRLYEWLTLGAINQLDPTGQPIHPPAIYSSSKANVFIVPKSDTPNTEKQLWLGYAHLDIKTEKRVDIIGWSELLEHDIPENIAAAILLPKALPFEYPTSPRKLFNELIKCGINQDTLYVLFSLSVAKNPDNSNLYFVLGSPMRGVSGSDDLKHHIAVWEINKELVNFIRLETKAKILESQLASPEDREALNRIALDCKAEFDKLLSDGDVVWCSVKEDRPEITTRRDVTTNISVFKDKAVAIWGCGALGGYVAEILVRAGIRHITLRDNKLVSPGIIVRQNFVDKNIGYTKSSCLRNYLLTINPDLDILFDNQDISRCFEKADELNGGVDLIIDATASNILAAKFEKYSKGYQTPIIASMSINHLANKGILAVIKPSHSGKILDLDRRAKLSSCVEANDFLDAFWPEQVNIKAFQPEPGCSEPTFIGSCADIMMLSSSMMNQLAHNIYPQNRLWSASVDLISSDNNYPEKRSFRYQSDLTLTGVRNHFDVRLSRNAWKKIKKEIKDSDIVKGEVCETGGLLFGQIDEATGIIWITEVIGPPEDSVASPQEFVCGIQGTSKITKTFKERSRNSVEYIGMWHTHPVSKAAPSDTDIAGMAGILAVDDFMTPKQLLMIVGYSSSRPEIGVYLFNDKDIEEFHGIPFLSADVLVGDIKKVPEGF